MKPLYSLRLLILAALLSGFSIGAFAQATSSFNYTGGVQLYSVPSGVSAIKVDAVGANGGNSSNGYTRGYGGRVQCTLAVTAGSTLYIYVGGNGTNGVSANSEPSGYNDSGAYGGWCTSITGYGGGGGGGGTDIRMGGTTLANRVVVAGGGGGAGCDCSSTTGGNGGGLTGASGGTCGDYGGGGGGPTSGGSGGSYSIYGTSSSGVFGWGGIASTTPYQSPGSAGGGGGGGWYGGGGGSWGGGGGGSSYTSPTLVTSVTHTQGYNTAGVPYVNITPIVPTLIDSPATALAFGNVAVGGTSPVQVYYIGGISMPTASGTFTVTAAPGFSVSTSPSGPFSSTAIYSFTSANFPAIGNPVYVEFTPTAYSIYTSTITATSAGVTYPPSLSVSGTGISGCSGTPSTGTALVSPSSGTSGPFTLSLSPAATVGGLAYQWYSWVSGVAGSTFAPIPGASTATYTYNPSSFTSNTFFECVVSCTSSGLSATSNIAEAAYTSTVTCSGIPTPGTLAETTTAGCSPSFSPTVFIDGSTTSSGITYAWLTSTTSSTTGFSPVSGVTTPYYTPTVTGTIWIEGFVTCNGSSPISRATPSVKLTLNPVPTPITGSPIICLGTASLFGSTPAGGTWSTSNAAIAIIGASGIATGVAPGAASITYTAPTTGCIATQTVGVNTGAGSITGNSTVCVGFTTPLSDLIAGGTWSSSNTAMATVGSTGSLTGVSAGTAVISYAFPSGCVATWPITINPLPAAMTGTFSACVGQTSLLSDATPGGTWSSIDPFIASPGSSSGIVSGVGAGVTNVRYILPTGCRSIQSFTVNALPAAITHTGSGAVTVCPGTTVTLTDGAGTWTSSTPSLATVGATTGIVTAVSPGSVTITYNAPVTGCAATITVNVNTAAPLQNVTVSNGGGYCPGGSGVHIGLNGSITGAEYYLYYSGIPTPVDSLVDSASGSSSSIDFGLFAGLGTYSVTAENYLGCRTNMTTTATVFNNTPPPIDTVEGGGSFCSGTSGVNILLNTSTVGVNYQLLYGGVPVGPLVAGTGGGLNFGPQTGNPNPFTVEAQNALTLCVSNMYGEQFAYPSAAPTVYTVSAGGSYCAGGPGVDIYLSNSTAGIQYDLYRDGVYDSSLYGVTGLLDFGDQMDSGTYTITAIDFTNGCTDNMSGTGTVVINPLPHAYTVTGGGNYCAGGTGEHVGLDYSATGVSYTLNNSLGGSVGPVSGTSSGLDFGLQTNPGVYTVTGTITATGCSAPMTGSATINVNTPPNVYNLIAPNLGHYCLGTGGDSLYIDGSDLGSNFKYQLYLNGVPVGSPLTGTGSAISFGHQTAAGNYTVIGENTTTLCSSVMNGPAVVTVDSLPHNYIVSGGGDYCAGSTGVSILLSNSDLGVNYELYDGTTGFGPVAGVGGTLTFAPSTMPGVYTVVATNSSCHATMAGSATVNINPLPGRNTMTGGGNYCSGGTGLPVGLSASASGISYQLMNGLTMVGTPLSGTGSPLNFGIKTASGTYFVVATNELTTCTDTMTGTSPINILPLPGLYTVMGGGSYCIGDTGRHVTLSGSDLSGVTYNLYDGSTLAGTQTATGSAIDFGRETAGGTYMVVATTTAGCSLNMLSSVAIAANAAPAIYDVTGGGNICAGDTGSHIFLSGSNTFVNYQLVNGTDTGVIWAGTGLPLDLGLETIGGTYHVIATSVTDFCGSNMSGAATIVVNPTVAASVTISTAARDTVCSGSTVMFTATGVNGGSSPMYQWTVNGANAGVGSSYHYTPANGDNVAVMLTSDALCASPAVATSPATVITLTPSETPAVSITASANNQCPGVAITFSATATNGGTAPVYAWKVGGRSVGSSTPTYTYMPADSDVVFATLASNYPCLTTTLPVLSNVVTEMVNAPVIPMFNIAVNPPTTLTYGETTTLSAMVMNAGTSTILYQWQLNGTNISGATNASYTSNTLKNNDVVCAVVTGENTCGLSAPVTQCQTMLIYGNTGVAQAGNNGSDIQVAPNPNKGMFVIKGTLGSAITTDQEVSLEITDMLGQVVYSSKVITHNGAINEQVQLSSGLANGMYLLNVHSGTTNEVFHFVIEQ